MRRVFAMAAAAISLAGCSSFSTDSWKMDYFSSSPAPVLLQLESTPPGAEARTSVGPGCKTPCSVSLTPPQGSFTVSYAMPNFQPASVPVQVVRTEGSLLSSGTVKIEPNPVVVELQPAAPPPKAHKPIRPKRKKPTTASAPADAADPASAPPALR